jgi:hypothetical protein
LAQHGTHRVLAERVSVLVQGGDDVRADEALLVVEARAALQHEALDQVDLLLSAWEVAQVTGRGLGPLFEAASKLGSRRRIMLTR